MSLTWVDQSKNVNRLTFMSKKTLSNTRNNQRLPIAHYTNSLKILYTIYKTKKYNY